MRAYATAQQPLCHGNYCELSGDLEDFVLIDGKQKLSIEPILKHTPSLSICLDVLSLFRICSSTGPNSLRCLAEVDSDFWTTFFFAPRPSKSVLGVSVPGLCESGRPLWAPAHAEYRKEMPERTGRVSFLFGKNLGFFADFR